MTATIRLVLDQLVTVTDADLAEASLEIARALVQLAPAGCAVEAIAPAGTHTIAQRVPGIGAVRSAPLQRRELLAAWQLGVAPGIGGGMLHSPTLAAPLARHDRANDGDQVVPTLWDLRAWEAPAELARGSVSWQRAMLKRAVRYADALVVPTHALAERLAEHAGFGERIRVIAGAAPEGFRVPTDQSARLRDLALPEQQYVALSATLDPSDGLETGLRAAAAATAQKCDVVVFGAKVDQSGGIADLAAAAGLPERRVHVLGELESADRAAVLGGAALFIATATRTAWPWRVPEALALQVPVVALDTPSHREVLADGGVLGEAAELRGAVEAVMADLPRARVRAGDRGRAYAWSGAAERIWQLHADL